MLLIEARNVSTCGNPLAHHIQVPGTRREDQKLMNREHAKRHRVGESESLAQAPPQNRT
jgi:hypothetical protein